MQFQIHTAQMRNSHRIQRFFGGNNGFSDKNICLILSQMICFCDRLGDENTYENKRAQSRYYAH